MIFWRVEPPAGKVGDVSATFLAVVFRKRVQEPSQDTCLGILGDVSKHVSGRRSTLVDDLDACDVSGKCFQLQLPAQAIYIKTNGHRSFSKFLLEWSYLLF